MKENVLERMGRRNEWENMWCKVKDTKKHARMYSICLYRVPRDSYLKMVKSDSNTSLLDSDAHSVSVPWLYWLVVVVSKGDRLYWD